jgi:hypothetical protein
LKLELALALYQGGILAMGPAWGLLISIRSYLFKDASSLRQLLETLD